MFRYINQAFSIPARLALVCAVLAIPAILAMTLFVAQSWKDIAFSNKEELKGRYLDTSADNFALTMNVSCYSFTAVAQRAVPLMKDGGSLLTLTYYGAERVIPHYNVMGVAKAALEATVRYLASELGPQNIRVNAISAGPLRTLASAGISGFSNILGVHRDRAPLRRNLEVAEVAEAALFLLSPASRAITGEVMMVDGGFSIMAT